MTETSPSPTDRLTQIRERAARATKGPWASGLRDWNESGTIKTWQVWAQWCPMLATLATGVRAAIDERETQANVEFAAHAREDIPWLLELVASKAAEITRLGAETRRGSDEHDNRNRMDGCDVEEQ